MSELQQLSLFDAAPLESPPTTDRWLYPLCTLFNSGDSGLYHIAASSKEEARAIAENLLRSKGIPFRAVVCCLGTYWCKSLDGSPAHLSGNQLVLEQGKDSSVKATFLSILRPIYRKAAKGH